MHGPTQLKLLNGGDRAFTITTHSKDLKVGGHWRYTMHGPDGVNYENVTKYLEVEDYSKLVYDHGGNDERKPLFRVTVLFSEKKGKTTMEMTMTLPTPEEAEQTRMFIKKAGGESTWDRLGEFLEEKVSGAQKFVINRSFDAPIELIFEMWTNPKHFSQWIAPVGFSTEYKRADIKPGGNSFFSMANDSGIKFFGRANYIEIEKPNRIVYSQQFCDENEKQSRHPMAPIWPAIMLNTVELTAESPDRTRVTVTTECYGDTTPDELEAFVKARGGMTIGWTGSFDKLDDYLTTPGNLS
jgi:uncharacterized protein YndB with AHSA1/START domain